MKIKKLIYNRSIKLLVLLLLLGSVSLHQTTKGSNLTITAISSSTFISRWNTNLISTGSSTSHQIRLPLESIGTYNFTVDWGDGINNTVTSWDQTEVTHTYTSEGVYTIIIEGTLVGWRFDNSGDKLKIIEISQWGNINLGNSASYFFGSSNLELTATDTLNLTGTTTLYQAFRECYNLGADGNMNNWDVSSITNMENMFYLASSFNQPIGNWNVSRVTNMYAMFAGASFFNQPIGNWDVSGVINMGWMFSYAHSSDGNAYGITNSFNQPIGDWDVSRVTTMDHMFFEASSFNQPIGNWNVSRVTNMHAMFGLASSFDQSIGNWDVSKVSKIDVMFFEASSFNQPIGNWDVSSATNMQWMFHSASSFNQLIRDWDVSSVTSMDSMFYSASSFNQQIGSWDVSSVMKMDQMFERTTLSTSNYDNLLEGWAALSLQSDINFHGGNSRYTKITERQYITVTFGWTIVDGGPANTVPPDIIPPDVNSPLDLNYEFGSLGNEIVWSVEDLHAGVYNVTKDGALYVADALWSNGTITLSVNRLGIGVHTFVIYVYDSYGNMISDAVIVNVSRAVESSLTTFTGTDSNGQTVFESRRIEIILLGAGILVVGISYLRKSRRHYVCLKCGTLNSGSNMYCMECGKVKDG